MDGQLGKETGGQRWPFTTATFPTAACSNCTDVHGRPDDRNGRNSGKSMSRCSRGKMKGQSRSHPSLSVTDEFAVGYELWDQGQPRHQAEAARDDRHRQ